MSFKSNKFSNITTYIRRGKQVIRTLPLVYKTPQDPLSIDIRSKYSVGLNFCKKFSAFYKIYWQNPPVNYTYWNDALSYCLKNSIIKTGSIYEIDYTAAKITNGELINSSINNLVPAADRIINCEPVDNSGTGNALSTDKLFFFYFIEDLQQVIVNFNTNNFRNSATISYQFTQNISGMKCNVYATWLRPDKSIISNSVYIGNVIILP